MRHERSRRKQKKKKKKKEKEKYRIAGIFDIFDESLSCQSRNPCITIYIGLHNTQQFRRYFTECSLIQTIRRRWTRSQYVI